MSRFTFRFEALLKVRKIRQDEALASLGAAQRAHQEALVHKQSLVDALSAALLRREKLGEEPVGIQAFHLEQDFIGGTKARIIRAEQGIVRTTRGVEKALRAYLFARKQARMIEVLEERARKQFKEERAVKERKELDELMIMRDRLREESA